MFFTKNNVIPPYTRFAAHDFRGEVVAENPFTGRKILKISCIRRPIFQTPQSIKIQVLAFLPLSTYVRLNVKCFRKGAFAKAPFAKVHSRTSAFRESAFRESAFRESASLPLAHRLKYRCNFAKCPYGVSRRDERVVNRVQLPAELRLEHLLLVPVAALQRLRGASRSLADM